MAKQAPMFKGCKMVADFDPEANELKLKLDEENGVYFGCTDDKMWEFNCKTCSFKPFKHVSSYFEDNTASFSLERPPLAFKSG
jgi:hypothetical protein